MLQQDKPQQCKFRAMIKRCQAFIIRGFSNGQTKAVVTGIIWAVAWKSKGQS